MKLNRIEGNGSVPDYDTLKNIVLDYREFVGVNAAFHVEYDWWPDQFETDDEKMDFHLNEYARPDNYEVIDQWHDEAVEKLAACEVELMDTHSSRNLWRAAAIALLISYLVLWYLWKSNN